MTSEHDGENAALDVDTDDQDRFCAVIKLCAVTDALLLHRLIVDLLDSQRD